MMSPNPVPGSACWKASIVAAILGCALVGGCRRAPEPVAQVDIDRAQAALVPFKEELVDALTEALGEGRAESAIRVCRERAPEIAAGLSVGGVRMGRTSHKTRNPDNAPQPWMEPLLAAYLEEPIDPKPRAVRLDETTFGYVEPIYTIHFCLSCHGPSVEPALLEEIRSLYPQDQATGFRANELRGLFWVTMPLGEGGA